MLTAKVLIQQHWNAGPLHPHHELGEVKKGYLVAPALPTPQSILDEKRQLIALGELTIGEPCSPYVITKHVVTNEGDVVNKTVELHGRKIPLLELRQRLLTQQEKFMRLMTDNDIQKLSREQIIDEMERIHHTPDLDKPLEALQLDLAGLQRTRTIAMWHDHSTVLRQGYILFAIWIIYDPAIFFNEDEINSEEPAGRNRTTCYSHDCPQVKSN